MKDILINFDKYYINQGDPNYGNILFKNKTTVRSYGCGVCCASMIICRSLNLTEIKDKQDVVKKVIADATNSSGLLTYANINFNGNTFRFIRGIDSAGLLLKNEPSICRLNGHFVLIVGYDTSKQQYEAYLIKDPGAAANRHLRQPMLRYGNEIKDKIALRLV